MYMKQKKCKDCYKPAARRLALFQVGDEYECYAESYVKCFWGLCDHHKSSESFAKNTDGKIITTQPKRQESPYRYQFNDILMAKY